MGENQQKTKAIPFQQNNIFHKAAILFLNFWVWILKWELTKHLWRTSQEIEVIGCQTMQVIDSEQVFVVLRIIIIFFNQ